MIKFIKVRQKAFKGERINYLRVGGFLYLHNMLTNLFLPIFYELIHIFVLSANFELHSILNFHNVAVSTFLCTVSAVLLFPNC